MDNVVTRLYKELADSNTVGVPDVMVFPDISNTQAVP